MNTLRAHEEQIFSVAIEIDDRQERSAYLDAACGDDDELREAVERLVALHDTAGDFLDTPPLAALANRPAEAPGDVIGRYRLVEKIGEGGFGVAWRAVQQEPVQREVALKIIKQGGDRQQIIARFAAERQTLAMMNHANIATVLDAGNTDQGRPYFVMELIAGQSIDDFCDQQQPLRSRLELFVRTCRAVHHAHQKGIVHRDLKPSNILVATRDGEPTPTIIDFGIATAIRSTYEAAAASRCQPNSRRDHTSAPDGKVVAGQGEPPASMDCAIDAPAESAPLQQLAGTPEYMSPEQIALATDVDTRADVYGLGGVLYRLLTGQTPFAKADLRQASLGEVARVICEDVPTQPSDTLAEARKEAHAASHDSATGISPTRLRGDLDWIVMKALEKDRSRRYGSAAELAHDVERFLACETVAAAPPSRLYASKKFIQRNRLPVLAASLVIAALVIGAVAATIGFVGAERQRRIAESHRQQAIQEQQLARQQRDNAERQRAIAVAEGHKAMRVAELLEEMIGGASPERGHAAEFTMRQQLDQFSAGLGDELQDYPLLEARLRRTIGRLYLTLREAAQGEPHLQRALVLRQRALPANDRLVLQSQVDYSWYLYIAVRVSEARRALEEALPHLREFGPSGELIEALDLLGRIYAVSDDQEQSDLMHCEAWSVARELYGEHDPVTLLHQGQAARARRLSEPAEAERLARDALERLRSVRAADHVDVARAKVFLAKVLVAQEKSAEAEQLIRDALEVHRKMFDEDSVFVVHDLITLANILRADGRQDEALEIAREAVAQAERCPVESEKYRLMAYRTLATVARRVDADEAADARLKAIAEQRRLVPDHRVIPAALQRTAFNLRQLGRTSEAEQAYRDALAMVRNDPSQHALTIRILYAWSDLLQEAGEHARAEPLLREVVANSDPTSLVASIAQIDLVHSLIALDEQRGAQLQIDEMLALGETGRSSLLAGAAQIAQAQLLIAESDYTSAAELLDVLHQNHTHRRLLARIAILYARCGIQLKHFETSESRLLRAARGTEGRPLLALDRRRVARQLAEFYEAWGKTGEAAVWRE